MLGRCHLPIETMLFLHPNLFRADVPLANISGSVTCLLEGLAYSRIANRYMCFGTVGASAFARVKEIGKANSLGVLSCQQGSAGRRADTT